MERAYVLVGVSRSGRLPTLPAVADGVARIRAWVTGQGIPDESVTVLTDANGGEVTIGDIFDAVRAFAQRRTVSQLVVYFCGHGIVNDGTELWLLTGAPSDPGAAVNVAKSVRLAERGTIPHVVLLSDACRTPAVTLNYGEVTGGSIFESPEIPGDRKVDVFYAARVGEPSHQVAPAQADAAAQAVAKEFHAVWSEVLADALGGAAPDALVPATESGEAVDLVRPWPLHRALPALLYARLEEYGAGRVEQVPDSRITSDPELAWLSRLPRRRDLALRGGLGDGDLDLPAPDDPDAARAGSAAARILEAADAGGGGAGDGGAGAVRVHGAEAGRVTFAGGCVVVDVGVACVAVPTFGRECSLLVEEGRLVDVRWNRPGSGPDAAWAPWRARLASRARFGLGWLDDPDEAVDRALEAAVEDPSVPVYVAHGLVDAGRRAQVPELLARLREDGLPVPYDVALLAEDLDVWDGPALPLLARGWALLGPDGVAPAPDAPPRLASLWTAFPASAHDALIALLDRREFQHRALHHPEPQH